MAQRPSDWVNLQDYLGLNQDQGQAMGDKVTSDVSGQAAQAGKKINSDANSFQAGAEAGTQSGPDANAFNTNQDQQYTADQAAANATKGYSGPNTLDDVDANLGQQVSDAMQRVQNTQSSYGLGTELQKSYGNQASTSTGGSALDSFLTGATSADKLKSLGTSYQGLQDQLGLAETNAESQASQGKATSTANEAQWAKLQPMIENQDKTNAALQGQNAFLEAQRAYLAAGTPGSWQNHSGHRDSGDELQTIDDRTAAYQQGNGQAYDAANPTDATTADTQTYAPPALTPEQYQQQLENARLAGSGISRNNQPLY